MYTSGMATAYMLSSLYRASVFALYQLSLVVGIALLPLALGLDRIGLRIPIGRVVDRLGDAYERAAAT